ncbi:TonB family protein [Mucilaginibacter sp. E4BP6]|uniref:M56 family metallopeptidase n=1 Tax=Mucilaginibacter sp. E4BP6 TaxID=2723089 RepID=UPI0015C96705|nr:M56 family metallopeptidase [Mucilaginibacter sp. E4BP6]NYE64852.1 TonB family protein [Mucilaginibacter sp. E4BP6]
MNGWQYLLLVNIYLVLFYGFYALLLRKETFFQLNRVYLVSAAALSFCIPAIQAGWVQNLFITQEVHYAVYGSQITISQLKPVADVPVSIGQILAYLYFIGVLFLVGRLIWQLVVLNKIIKSDQQGVAYSFFKRIKVDQHADNNLIINAHEQVHAQQWHSADVFIIEAVMIINWFNPVVYFYRRAIKHVHEFIADDKAIKSADNKADYAMLLLTQTFEVPTHNLVSHFFNHSLLKQRIIMLQKNKSQRVKLLKYGLSAPLFVLMLILSSATVNNSKAVKVINLKAEQVLATPAITGNMTNKPADSLNRTPAYAEPSAIVKTNAQDIKKDLTVSATDTLNKDNSQVFAAVEQAPSFPGGTDAFYKFLARNTIYPAEMRANNIQGKVIVTFVVEKDGSLSNVRTLKGPGYGANEEAVRVVSLSPRWTHGNQNGRAVRVQFTTSLIFSLADTTTNAVANADTGKKPIDVVLVPPGKAEPLYVIDGKEIKTADFKTVNPSDINAIYVLQNKAAVAKYGSKGKNGVIVIYTKAYKGQLPPGPVPPVTINIK